MCYSILKEFKKLLICLEQRISFLYIGATTQPKKLVWDVWIGAKNRFKSWVWDIEWLRNILLLILAVLLVRYYFPSDWIDNFNQGIGFIREQLMLDTGSLWYLRSELFLIFLIFCVFISASISVAKILSQVKGIKLFLAFITGFLVVKFWDEFICSLNNLIQGTFNFIFYNVNEIIKSIISSRIHNPPPPKLTADQINNITQDIVIKTISSLFTLTNILQLIALILLGTLLYLFFRWLSSSSGIIILPFDTSNLKLSNAENNVLGGKAIADLLAAKLHHIYHIHNLIEDREIEISPTLLRVCLENLNLRFIKGENISQTLAQAGSIQIANSLTLQMGSILLTLRQLWPWGSVQVISGSLWQNDDFKKVRLAGRYEQINHRSNIHTYEIKPSEDAPDIPNMVHELAYRIALDSASTQLSTSSWSAFKFLTEALSHFYHYIRTKSLDNLNNAFDACKEASQMDKNYKKVGDLLSLISFSYLDRDEYEKAEESLEKAMEIYPDSPYVQGAAGTRYYVLGQFEKALEHYQYAQELKPDRYEIYIRLGMVRTTIAYDKDQEKEKTNAYEEARFNFTTALILSPNNDAAQSALAWLDFLCYRNTKKIEFLEIAYRRLNSMPRDKMTHIDYSNLALFLLCKTNSNSKTKTESKMYDNWWKALQKSQYEKSDATVYDRLLEIFFKLLTTNKKEQNQIFEDLDKLIKENKFPCRGVIKGLLEDSKTIREECDKILSNNTLLKDHESKDRLETYKTSMHKFSNVLNQLLGNSPTTVDIHLEIDVELR